tara:strand:- start:177 stop:482 length:306 start_codon:yes stop_codon:yes gene_type:complete
MNSLFTVLKGEFLSNKKNQKYVPYLLSLVLLILVNINISFRAEKLLKNEIKLEQQVADLRLIYITTKSDLMRMYRRSTVEELVKTRGLKTSINPPYILEKK